MAVQASSFMREASSITAAPCHATAPSPPMQVMPASMPSSAPGLRLRSMPCHACSDTQMPSPSPPMQSKTLPWPRCLHPCLRAHRSRCASEMPASMPSSAPGLRLRSMPCHACSDTQMPSPSPHAFAPQPQDRCLRHRLRDACIHAFVRSRPASSLHAMSRLQRYADAFAIAPHAVQDVALAPMPASMPSRSPLAMRHVTLPRP